VTRKLLGLTSEAVMRIAAKHSINKIRIIIGGRKFIVMGSSTPRGSIFILGQIYGLYG